MGWVWSQDLQSAPRCRGPECTERIRVEEKQKRHRLRRKAETRVDRFGRPKPSRRAERFRPFVYSPRHKPMERWEAFTPYSPPVKHKPRIAERQRTPSLAVIRSPRRMERLKPPVASVPHKQRAEKLDFPFFPLRHKQRAEKQSWLLSPPTHRQRAERYAPPIKQVPHSQRSERHFIPSPHTRHPQRAERQTSPSFRPQHKQRAEKVSPILPYPLHKPKRAERYSYFSPQLSHQPAPERVLYPRRPPRHRRSPGGGCAPPPIPHSNYAEALSCKPPRMPRIDFDRYTCRSIPIPHKNFDKYSCSAPIVNHYFPKRSERLACAPPSLRHKNFDRYRCSQVKIAHRNPRQYKVSCDAHRRGTYTATERLAHDLRYLFTNHRKHCEVMSAYTGVATGEWVNTREYGRVPVAGVKMGWRVYVFAHFYDRKGKFLKKPRIEKRKVWAVKQLEVWTFQPVKGKRGRRRYIRGLPGIEGFGMQGNVMLVKKRLSVEETKAIQIEKFIRKRQIAWLVMAYPEERVRLSEWLKKYAGPKPRYLWPGIDYRLLEIW
ncbi:MAG: hypothetical protein RMJ66_05505 [Bacteroidia bacterium]|nr:hypothetical protein [Bacteroidia bacterium]MDW8134505.1 hypothetical protein [Bacteroidia bacterium]